MSEYQFVHFLAIDRPLDDEQLEFMRRQSSRAEITSWEFTNEYHYGDFHGNAEEMLRRGYDVHLHYANFGMRRLMIRLPAGLPCDHRTFKAFCPDYGMKWIADKKGKGGILELYPEADAGSFDQDVYDAAKLLPKIAPIRELLISGDLRPLYLAWLACADEDEAMEPPVPAGLGKLTAALEALAEFYEVHLDVIAAAAERSPPLPEASDADEILKRWIAKQSPEALRELVERLLGKEAVATRAETLARIRDEMDSPSWPLAEPTRTMAQLRELAGELGNKRLRKEQEANEAARRKRLKKILATSDEIIANVEKLAQGRSVKSYREAASELADLREALGPIAGPPRARAVAEKLRRQHPKLHRLLAELRKHDLLD